MSEQDEHVPMTDKTHKPTEEEMLDFIGDQGREKAWSDLREFIESHYEIEPETTCGGPKYGWEIRYRIGGKTLCSLTPWKGGFTLLLVLGKEDSKIVLAMADDLSDKTLKLIKNTKQLHDGRWLWIRPSDASDVEDVKKLLQVKRKPKKVQVSEKR
jgi:hypothetical protein